uniref:Uncharacterized protein n=1 Tax=Pyrodinium bahamense TaxID=73915 RepID=A0A7S0AEX7_9DINO|mmetsp:Transcript_32642/g.90034  ORF Transcript_32642/g.90034 Transcript_32642/m.90034 type:complete len:220 (+) Transcript_32642:826-1485(+)
MQEKGLPIDFGVLRREFAEDCAGNAEEAIEGFFSATDMTHLAGKLQQKFGPSPSPCRLPTPCSAVSNGNYERQEEGFGLERCESITENPYVQALRKRREDLQSANSDRWMLEDGAEPLAARLATHRSDALATLTVPAPQEGRRGLVALPAPLALAGCIAGGGGRHCAGSHSASCMASHTIQPTPRVDLEGDVQAWAVPEVLKEEASGSAHFAVLLKPRR